MLCTDWKRVHGFSFMLCFWQLADCRIDFIIWDERKKYIYISMLKRVELNLLKIALVLFWVKEFIAIQAFQWDLFLFRWVFELRNFCFVWQQQQWTQLSIVIVIVNIEQVDYDSMQSATICTTMISARLLRIRCASFDEHTLCACVCARSQWNYPNKFIVQVSQSCFWVFVSHWWIQSLMKWFQMKQIVILLLVTFFSLIRINSYRMS